MWQGQSDFGNSLVVQWLRLLTSTAEGAGLIEDTFKKLKGKIYFSEMFADLHSIETNEPELLRQQTVGNCKDDSGCILFHGRRSGLLLTEKPKSAFT